MWRYINNTETMWPYINNTETMWRYINNTETMWPYINNLIFNLDTKREYKRWVLFST